MKLVGLPLPVFQVPLRDMEEMDFVPNDGSPDHFRDGFADGPGFT